ncbi:MAG: lytic transglycosylase [Spirochaetae bacterium HGW-Spirochaetae-9]|nr:MAG: lytic transglycosylase [Spirochaetae bacterium HGW-Spirochaetae-9]
MKGFALYLALFFLVMGAALGAQEALPAETVPGEAAPAEAVPSEAEPAEAVPSEAAAPDLALSEPVPADAPAEPDIILSAGILVDGLQFDIEMPWGQPKFEEIRESYMTSGGKRWLKTVMERSLPYIDYIEAKIEEYGLPKELVYLPVIESEFSPLAVSRSGATGLWQFMRNSIAGYDMTISDWKDDRRDFMKSTDGALRKLEDNYDALGDWLLAIVAYNAGMGAVQRAMKSAGSDPKDFWHLWDSGKLSRESTVYVPKFLAVASILRYPELHGLPMEWGERHSWEALETKRQVDLTVLAERAGISLDLLKQGNAELKYHITPPSEIHLVKVPAYKAEEVRSVLEDTSTPLFKYDIYKVKSGDTLSAVAQRYATPLSMIIDANPGLKPDKIRIGQTIIVPKLSGKPAAAAKTPAGAASAAPGGTYVVKKGDTLGDIAFRLKVKAASLASANGIGIDSILRIGQKLKVPGS